MARRSACIVSKRKADTLDTELSSSRRLPSQLLGLVNNFQPLPAFMLIFITKIVIRFCDRVDSGVSHLKGMNVKFYRPSPHHITAQHRIYISA